MAKEQHKWTEDDDRIAFYMYRYGARFLPKMDAGIAKLMGTSEGSLARRRANFAFLDGKPGLPNFAKQSQRIYEEHKSATESEFRAIVLRALEAKPQ